MEALLAEGLAFLRKFPGESAPGESAPAEQPPGEDSRLTLELQGLADELRDILFRLAALKVLAP